MTEMPVFGEDIELAHAHRFIDAARHLAAGSFYADSVSRAYYAAFHAGCALLASIGRTVRAHDGLRAMVGEHFVRTGKLDPKFARLLAHTAADRNDADYNSVAVFSKEDAEVAILSASEFVDAVENLLRKV